jgi:hypothetical protein
MTPPRSTGLGVDACICMRVRPCGGNGRHPDEIGVMDMERTAYASDNSNLSMTLTRDYRPCKNTAAKGNIFS